jgi:UDP-N-acetylglucosamine 2-epimerase (non-hydrolysing)
MDSDLPNNLTVMTVVGTRPEIIKLSRVINKLDECFQHILVHTGQNYDYELSQIFFEDLEIRKPDYFLDAAASTAAQTIGNTLISIDRLLDDVQPDALLILGDTNSCLCVISAKRRKIPIFHMEAGNRCFDMRVPEEINRRIVDHTSDVNMTYSDIARDCLLNEGMRADLIIKTGSPMMEVINHYRKKIENSTVLDALCLNKGCYFLISSHREENIESDVKFKLLCELINGIARRYQCPVILSTHPRTMKKINAARFDFDPLIKILKPLSFTDYCKLQLDARVVVSDSGTITEEASILGFSALNIRESQERHEGMEEATVALVGLNPERVLQGIELIEKHAVNIKMQVVYDYDVLNVSNKVAKIILSYVDFVNRVIWNKG